MTSTESALDDRLDVASGDKSKGAKVAKDAAPETRFSIDLDKSRAPRIALGHSVVVAGNHNFHVHDGNVVSRDINISEFQDVPKVSVEQAFERIGAAFRLNLQQLEKNVEQAREESSQFSDSHSFFPVLGFSSFLEQLVYF